MSSVPEGASLPVSFFSCSCGSGVVSVLIVLKVEEGRTSIVWGCKPVDAGTCISLPTCSLRESLWRHRARTFLHQRKLYYLSFIIIWGRNSLRKRINQKTHHLICKKSQTFSQLSFAVTNKTKSSIVRSSLTHTLKYFYYIIDCLTALHPVAIYLV